MSTPASYLATPISRIKAHLSSPLYRNAYALVFNIGVTSSLGFIFWLLAARNYTTEAVGMNSAAISTMIFLANLSQFQLVNALNRFLPRAGRSTGRMILGAYLVSLFMAFVSSLIFITGLGIWSPELSPIRSNPYVILWFTASTMAWCIFVLQDGAFIGLRQATWVPIENFIFALSKIVLLILFASLIPQFGIFASWTVPVILLILPTNLLIFWYLVPKHIHVTQAESEHFSTTQVARYIMGDYFSSLIWMGTTNLLPLMVVGIAGATANAYYYLSWIIAYSLYLVSSYMGKSLIAEAANEQSKLVSYSYRILVQNARIVIPAAIFIVIVAPLLLSLFGEEYSSEGTLLLRLLTLSAIPNIITSMFVSIARVQRRMGDIVITLGILCAMVITISYFLLGVYGITGVGVAWLVGQSVVALFLLITKLRMIILLHVNFSPVLRLIAMPRNLWRNLGDRWEKNKANNLLKEAELGIDNIDNSTSLETWVAQRVHHTVSDMTVITIGHPNDAENAILILPQSINALNSSQRRLTVLELLQDDERLGKWRELLPHVIAVGEIDGQAYQMDRILPGQPANELLSSTGNADSMLVNAASVIGKLHQRTSFSAIVDEEYIKRWVDEPLYQIQNLDGSLAPLRDRKEVFERTKSELWDTLTGRTLTLSWVHGDYWLGNILVSSDDYAITGILDWEAARPDEIPLLDIYNLLISTRIILQRKELGEVIKVLLHGDNWSSHEELLLNKAMSILPGYQIETQTMLRLYWMKHVAANITKSVRYTKNKLWVAKNVEAVLECL